VTRPPDAPPLREDAPESTNGPPPPLSLCHFALGSTGDALGCDGCRSPLHPYQYVVGRSDGHIFCCNECERQHPNVNIPTQYGEDS
jgi:hypothetical protein